MSIRNYTSADHAMLTSWWTAADMPSPPIEGTPATTYILEKDGIAVASVCLHLMNNSAFCMIDHLVSNPEIKNRKGMSSALIAHAEKEAKSHGYKYVVCLTNKDNLKLAMKNRKYIPVYENITTFAKEIT